MFNFCTACSYLSVNQSIRCRRKLEYLISTSATITMCVTDRFVCIPYHMILSCEVTSREFLLFFHKAKLAALETEVTECANNTTLYDAGVKAILSVLQNHVETALKTSEMSERVGGRTERYTSFKDRLKEKSGRNIDLILSGEYISLYNYFSPAISIAGRPTTGPYRLTWPLNKMYSATPTNIFRQLTTFVQKPYRS